jgi:hypothetical protein
MLLSVSVAGRELLDEICRSPGTYSRWNWNFENSLEYA